MVRIIWPSTFACMFPNNTQGCLAERLPTQINDDNRNFHSKLSCACKHVTDFVFCQQSDCSNILWKNAIHLAIQSHASTKGSLNRFSIWVGCAVHRRISLCCEWRHSAFPHSNESAYINLNAVANAISTSQDTTVLPESPNVQRPGNYYIETSWSESTMLLFA